MKRRTANLLALLSLLPCVAAVALWCRPYLRSDSFLLPASRTPQGGNLHYVRFCLGGGGISASDILYSGPEPPATPRHWSEADPRPAVPAGRARRDQPPRDLTLPQTAAAHFSAGV